MNELIQTTFWLCAVGGTVFFALSTLMTFLGGGDSDSGADVGDHHVSHDGVQGPDAAFKLLSVTSLTGFFMMFGWIGLTCLQQAGFSSEVSVLLALLAGLVSMYSAAFIFSSAKKLTSAGSNFQIENTIGQKASVYQSIPKDKRGQIQIHVSGSTHELDAISEDGQTIESHKSVVVVRVVDPQTVSVRPV